MVESRRRRKGDPVLPAHTIDSKQHIDQLMFLSAIGVPQQSPDGTAFSDGKIGIWALAERKPAQKSSKNRTAGTPEVKPIIVTADAFYDVMTRTDGVLDAVRKVNLDRVFMVPTSRSSFSLIPTSRSSFSLIPTSRSSFLLIPCSKLISFYAFSPLCCFSVSKHYSFLPLHLLFVEHALDGGTDQFSHPWPRCRGV